MAADIACINFGYQYEYEKFIGILLFMPIITAVLDNGKLIKVDIFSKENPLGQLGFIFTLNQMIYLLIVMWVFSAVPEKMIMVYAMVFGAHLFPYSWLYKSKGYTVVAISIPVISLILGCTLNGTTVAAAACIIEVVFACVLHMELKKMADN